MLRTLTFLKAAPYVLGLWLASTAAAGLWGYSKGYATSEAEHQAAGVQQLIDAVEKAAEIGQAIADIGVQLREQIAASREDEIQSTKTVRAANVAHPDFAAMRRPAEHQRVRLDQLERIHRAAEAD
jgi:hypothetical protein